MRHDLRGSLDSLLHGELASSIHSKNSKSDSRNSQKDSTLKNVAEKLAHRLEEDDHSEYKPDEIECSLSCEGDSINLENKSRQ